MRTEILFVLAASVSSTIGNLLLKYSRVTATAERGLLLEYLSPFFVAALIFYGLNVFLFARALDKLPVSLGYPILAGVGFVFLSIASAVVFHESLTLQQFFGMAVVVVGLFMMAGGGSPIDH